MQQVYPVLLRGRFDLTDNPLGTAGASQFGSGCAHGAMRTLCAAHCKKQSRTAKGGGGVGGQNHLISLNPYRDSPGLVGNPQIDRQ